MELHGGTLSIESRVGMGTTVTIVMPMKKDEAEVENGNA